MYNSQVLNLLCKVWSKIAFYYKNSLLKAFIEKSYNKLTGLLDGSLIYLFIIRESSWVEKSCTYRLYSRAIDRANSLFRCCQEFVSRYKHGSLVCWLKQVLHRNSIPLRNTLAGSLSYKLFKNTFTADRVTDKEDIDIFMVMAIGLAIFLLPFVPKMVSLLVTMLVVFIFLLKHLYRKGYALEKHFLHLPVVLLATAMVVCTVTSYNPGGSFRDLVIHLSAVGFLLVMVNTVRSRSGLNAVLTVFVFTATLVALYGLYQYKTGVELDKAWVDKANNPELRARVFSVFGNPNILAEYLIMAIPVSASLFWVSRKICKKGIFLLTTLLLVAALLLTFSRGGWLGFAFGTLVFITLIEKRFLLSLIPAGVFSLFIMPDSVINRIATIGSLRDTSNAYRITVWGITLDVIRDHWITGVGFGYIPFRETFVRYVRTINAYHSHNMYLEVLAEMGVGGFILLAVTLFMLFKYGIISLKKSKDCYTRIITAGVLASLSSILFHGLVENVLYMPRIIITFWTVVSFLLVAQQLNSRNEDHHESPVENIS